MPELPEVQAHAERLTARYAGTVLEGFTPITFTALKTAVPAPSDAVGVALDEVGRRGKYLLARFGDLTFVVHLMQGGRLREDAKLSRLHLRDQRGRVEREELHVTGDECRHRGRAAVVRDVHGADARNAVQQLHRELRDAAFPDRRRARKARV